MRLQKRMDKETGRRKESARPKETGGRRGSKRPGQVIGAAFLMVAVSSYAQYQISALSGLVMESYQITARQYSQVFTAAMIPGILLSLLCGILCDHFGIRRCFGAAVLISGAGGILRIWSQDYRTMAACMILTGIAITFVNSNGAKLVGMLYEKKRVSAVLGLLLTGAFTGMTLAMFSTARMFSGLKEAYCFSAVLLGTDFSRACILAVAAGFCINASTPVLVSAPLRLPEIGTVHGGTAGGVVATLQLLGAVCIPTLVISRLGGERYDYMILMAGGCFLINAALVFCLQDVFEKMEG